MKGVGYEVGNKVHAKYLSTLLRSPMGWFDEKPIGQILDRAIRYQNELDQTMIWAIDWFIELLVCFSIALIMVVRQTPINLLLILAMFMGFYKLNKVVRKPSDNILRLENREKEKNSSFVQETITGINTIRPFRQSASYAGTHLDLSRVIFTSELNFYYLRRPFINILTSLTSLAIIASITLFIVRSMAQGESVSSAD